MKKPKTILFQGDSITDVGRNRQAELPNDSGALGSGYACLAASAALAENPKGGLKFYNRGISGNRVVDLYARWKVDALNLRPDLISILIGVNDVWHERMSGNGVEVERYAKVYAGLLEWTRKALPGVRLVLCEPFVLPCGVVKRSWVPDIDQRRVIVRKLAGKFHAVFVPFHTLFQEALDEAPAEYWLPDGVHPSPAGHARMAALWRKCVSSSAT